MGEEILEKIISTDKSCIKEFKIKCPLYDSCCYTNKFCDRDDFGDCPYQGEDGI